jgi:hypothetical protein
MTMTKAECNDDDEGLGKLAAAMAFDEMPVVNGGGQTQGRG